ncbi:undecaprenyl-phosphate glucose phosphotransferase [Methyloprofundus sedimenti]|uniref:undecaprenyl-phosphate glucose phosphotransferase n=1 Tax=Methyloprofundus sedimenti TaxID=1420851 RepID=UPI0022B8BE4D|nr:undecaprenyl-phosphate glucose phosphotransferase [Methyloprofundus sedimenti]
MRKSSGGVIRQHNSKLIIIGRLVDTFVIGLTFWSVLEMNYMNWQPEYTWWLLISIFSFQIFSEFNDLYKESRGVALSDLTYNVAISWVCAIFILVVVNQVNQVISDIDKRIFFYWIVAVPIELMSWHIILSEIAGKFRSMGRNTRKVAIVGNTRIGRELSDVFINESWMGLNFVGFFDDRIKQREEQEQEQECVGNFSQVISQAKSGEVDLVYIALPLKAENRIKVILAELSDTTASVYYVPDLFVFDLLRSKFSFMKGIPIVSVHDTPFYGVGGVLKRIFDVVVGFLILCVILVPMIIIALAIKVTSPGNVLFKQRRYGFRGEEIVVWKFRSMTVTEDGHNVRQAQKHDPRITKLGAFLRRTSLDELPQFINVLQGRMSIVGPRPHAVTHNEFYRGQIKGYMLRHKVKPGITGLAQISGFRGETNTLDKMEGRVRYDLEYIRKWSLWLDVKIVFLTVFKGFVGAKAY